MKSFQLRLDKETTNSHWKFFNCTFDDNDPDVCSDDAKDEDDDGPPFCYTISLIYWDLTKTQLTVTGSGKLDKSPRALLTPSSCCSSDTIPIQTQIQNTNTCTNTNTSTIT